MRITRHDLEQTLTEVGIAWHRVDLQGTSSIIVSSYGGRIYGPFSGADSLSMNWVPDAFGESERLRDMVTSRRWNVGGERNWVGPEIRYMIPDRMDYWGSYDLPSHMDPGTHTLEASDGGVNLTSNFELESYLAPTGTVQFTLDLQVAAAANPLRQLQDFDARFGRTTFAGYVSTVVLSQSSTDIILSESWNLNQVLPGGIALIPTTTTPEVTDYYEPVGDNLSSVSGGVAVKLSGDRRFKIGVKAAQNFGRLGYVRRDVAGALVLTIRSFPNDPSAEYTEEPDFAPGVNGDSIHLYNDDGGLGGFAELEARGRTVGQAAGQTASSDRFTTWCYQGTSVDLNKVAHQLLGVGIPDYLLVDIGEAS